MQDDHEQHAEGNKFHNRLPRLGAIAMVDRARGYAKFTLRRIVEAGCRYGCGRGGNVTLSGASLVPAGRPGRPLQAPVSFGVRHSHGNTSACLAVVRPLVALVS
jgi:hypothetical protein